MGLSGKKYKQRQRERVKVDPPDQTILNSIGNPNVWTPEIEDIWLRELHKIPTIEIYRRFPPLKKPNNVSRRGKSYKGQ